MATQTLSTIQTITKNLLNDSSGTIVSDAEIAITANDGAKDVSVKSMCYEVTKTITLVAGTASYRIPTTSQTAFKVYYIDHNKRGLIESYPTAFGRVGPVSSTTYYGTPQTWFQWGDVIVLDPAPDSTAAAVSPGMTLYCACYPSLVITSSINDIPVEFHESVLEFTIAFSHLKSKRWGDMARYYNQYIDNLQRKRFEYTYKLSDTRKEQEQPNTVSVKFGEK